MSDYGSESEDPSVHSEDEEDVPVVKKGASTAVKLRKDEKGDDSDVSSVATDDDEDATNILSDVDDDDSDGEEAPEDEDAMFADDRQVKKGKSAKGQDEEDEFQFGFNSDDEDSEDEEEEDGNAYLQKLDESVREQTIANHHPELLVSNYEEVEALTHIVRDERGVIIDSLHRTLPFLTKYERTRILGERAKQINDGAKSFIETDPSVIDGYLIALAEFKQNKIPFIIRRPLANGASEYWKLKDLEML